MNLFVCVTTGVLLSVAAANKPAAPKTWAVIASAAELGFQNGYGFEVRFLLDIQGVSKVMTHWFFLITQQPLLGFRLFFTLIYPKCSLTIQQKDSEFYLFFAFIQE